MKFDTKGFFKNIKFFAISLLLIVILLLASLLFGPNTKKLKEEDLGDGDINIGKLVLNEILTSNKGVITSSNGNLYDYVEIFNGNDHDINLKDYGLSDESSVKWVFPETVIPAKGYVVVFLGGIREKGLIANFKLKSAGGEILTLFKPNGKVVDAVEVPALDSNTVMARNTDGKWVNQIKPTPGFANTNEGYDAFVKSLESDEDSDIVINEILPENRGNFINKNGEYSGYIEIINNGSSSVNLSGYSLSNDESVSFKWQIPNTTIGSGEVLLVYTSGKSRTEGEYSTSFKLRNKSGVVVLTNNKGKVIDKVKYDNIGNGVAYIREGKTFNVSSAISPGYLNNNDGIEGFQKKCMSTPKTLIINEAMNSNYSHLKQNGGNYYDWIELYNNSSETINLSEYCLSTSTNDICAYKLPNKELESGKYFIIMASGDENLSNSSYYHAGFKLGEVESIYLSKNRKVIDTLFLNDIPKGYSYGKGKNYGAYYYSSPTPNAENGSGTASVSYVPHASVKSGIFNDSNGFEVAINGSGKIYYTLDGSTPTTDSKVYSSPLTIKKTTVLRIMSKESGRLRSAVETYSYIVNENHKLDVISLALNPGDFNTINANTSTESKITRKVNAQLLTQDGGGFQIDAGLKLFGGSTRSYRKKSYELKFKKRYGDANLHYKVFDDVDSSVYNSLILRTGSQDEFQWSKRILIRDIVSTSLMKEHTKVDVQAYKPVVVYVNGKYWGLYFLREKIDETFVANHYNVAATKTNTDILRVDGEVKTGSNKKYNNMIKWITNNSLSNKNNYEKIKEQVDIENMCDFWIAEIYASNYDILNVRYFSNPEVDNGKWKFIFYDMDSAYYNVNVNYYTFYTNSYGMGGWNFPTTLLRNMMKSSEFKKTFLERLSYNLKNTWNYNTVSKKLDDIVKEVGEDEIKRNLERWDNISYSRYKTNINYVKNFAKKRNSYMKSQARSYFNLSNAEYKKYFGD